MTDTLTADPAREDAAPAPEAAATVDTPDAAPAPETDESMEDIWREVSTEEDDDSDTANADDDLVDDDDPQDEDGQDTADTSAQPQPAAPDPVEKANREKKAAEGRLRKSQQEITRLQAKIERLTTKAPPSPGTDVDKLKTAAEDYPDVVGPVVETLKEVDERLNALSARDAAEVQEAQSAIADIVQHEYGTLIDKHPDYNEVLKDHGPAYLTWIEDQPKRLRDIHTANFDEVVDGEGVAEVFEAFKKTLGLAPDTPAPAGETPTPPNQSARRKAQLDSAAAPRSKGPSVTADIQADSQSIEDIWRAEAQKERRRA